MKKLMAVLAAAVCFVLSTAPLYSHCQIPCGIYDDQLRITELKENTATIEKSINEIEKLQTMKEINYNQLVRWINNKDKHADASIEIATQYFLAQRLKPEPSAGSKDVYLQQLELLHKIIVYSMKTKQSLSREDLGKLKESIDSFEKSYMKK